MSRELYRTFLSPQGANTNNAVVTILNKINNDKKGDNLVRNVLNKIIRRERNLGNNRNARARKRRALILKSNLFTPKKTAPKPNNEGFVNNTNKPKPRTNNTPSTRSPRIRIIREDQLVGPYGIEALFSVVNTYEDKKTFLPTTGTIGPLIARCDRYQQYVNKMCKIASNYTYGDIFNSYDRRYLSNIITVIRQFCADSDYTRKRREIEKIPNNNNRERQLNSLKLQLNNRRSLPINNEKMQELVELCKRGSFDNLLKGAGKRDTNVGDFGGRFEDEIETILSRVKDQDASSALALFIKRNNEGQTIDQFIQSLKGESKNTLGGMRNEYRNLFNRLIQKLNKPEPGIPHKTKKVVPLILAVTHGPANHNSISQYAMQKMIENPKTLSRFAPRSPFLYFLNKTLVKQRNKSPTGSVTKRNNKGKMCTLRGNIDEALLRRRVVFGDLFHKLTSSANKAAQSWLSAANHGRMHRLKSLPSNGNTITAGTPRIILNNANKFERYLNAMRNEKVRNANMFKNVKNGRKLLSVAMNTTKQTGKNGKLDRVPVVFKDGKLTNFDQNVGVENPHIFWTTLGLHLEESGGMKPAPYKFFDFVHYAFDFSRGAKVNPDKYIRGKNQMGANYIIQLDSKTLGYLHKVFYFQNIPSVSNNTNYKSNVENILSSCSI
tara:strand:- start:28 stop:2019 length:1992 start_codon:yes stop_codon:yes gene_type:complete